MFIKITTSKKSLFEAFQLFIILASPKNRNSMNENIFNIWENNYKNFKNVLKSEKLLKTL